MPHVLILGGHGKIAQHLTPLLLRASHTVTSVIRADDQAPTIRGLAPADGRGTLHVLIRSLEDVTSQDRAQAILSEVKPDAVVFSAGAGGKGGADRLGRTGGAKGEVSRRTVAEVTARLVDAEGLQTSWVDLLDGQEDIDEAVKRVVKEGVDVAEGEPVYDKVRKA
ncbi:Putative Na(+)/H(+) antiporter C3A11.09 [Verticillium dahliae VDG2]|nr:Putative Na(+)/H(+) antiporter C3A11.09 [Verticillium dahliae VDG2]